MDVVSLQSIPRCCTKGEPVTGENKNIAPLFICDPVTNMK